MCNSGVSLTPVIDGQTYHFDYGGLYEGLFVMTDQETGSFWNHGEAMHGPLAGQRMPVSNLRQTDVARALATHPELRVALSDQFLENRWDPASVDVTIPKAFEPTLGAEDERRPRMDIGLGIWTDTTTRYYPMDRVRERGNALVDVVDGRQLLVYIEPETVTLAALFVDGTQVTWQNDEVHLDTGDVVQLGERYTAAGTRATERPQQIFTRWYGFALTFPGCEVFGQ